jgi:hypothetical protein
MDRDGKEARLTDAGPHIRCFGSVERFWSVEAHGVRLLVLPDLGVQIRSAFNSPVSEIRLGQGGPNGLADLADDRYRPIRYAVADLYLLRAGKPAAAVPQDVRRCDKALIFASGGVVCKFFPICLVLCANRRRYLTVRRNYPRHDPRTIS